MSVFKALFASIPSKINNTRSLFFTVRKKDTRVLKFSITQIHHFYALMTTFQTNLFISKHGTLTFIKNLRKGRVFLKLFLHLFLQK
jgi:hypothetical protein